MITTLKKVAVALALLSPAFAFAQISPNPNQLEETSGTIQYSIVKFLGFINDYLIPLIFAIAFIVFLWFIFLYFIAGGADEEKRAKGKQFLMWSIIGFVLMFSLWGIIALIRSSIGLDGAGQTPDLPLFQSHTTTSP